MSLRIESAGDRDLKIRRGWLYFALAEERSRGSSGERTPGATLRHVAVVRELKSAAEVDTHGPSTTEARFQLHPEWRANGLRVVAFISGPRLRIGVAAQKVMP